MSRYLIIKCADCGVAQKRYQSGMTKYCTACGIIRTRANMKRTYARNRAALSPASGDGKGTHET
jgi:hypothetical protein